jgi:ribose transport system permease protein
MAVGLATGTVCGVVNGALIAGFRLQAIVTTFAAGVIIGGLALKIMAQAGGALPAAYYQTYANTYLGVPFVGWMLLLLVLVTSLVARMPFYAHTIAVGGNRVAAYQTGLSVFRIRVIGHGLAGAMSALAALAILGVAGAGDPLMGQAFTLSSVSAIVLGGVSLAGGWGGAWGAILGATILGLVNNLIFFANIDYVYQSVVQGSIIVVALAAGVFFSRRPA